MRFEDLIARPAETLVAIGAFIDHDLDYRRIQLNPVHALKVPNSSFREERHRPDFSPIDRWKTRLSANSLQLCETLIGPWLQEMGYSGMSSDRSRPAGPHARAMRAIYPRRFAAKHFLKTRTPLGRVLTRTRVWTEQPRAGEDPVRSRATVSTPRLASDSTMGRR